MEKLKKRQKMIKENYLEMKMGMSFIIKFPERMKFGW